MSESSLLATLATESDAIDKAITAWMARYGLVFMRVSLGIVFFWFGALKLVPGLSPAEELVRNTTYFVQPDWFLPVLAIWEMAIGLGLIFGVFMRLTLLLLFLQLKFQRLIWRIWKLALLMENVLGTLKCQRAKLNLLLKSSL